MSEKRPAVRSLPAYDAENNITTVDRVRMAMLTNRMALLKEPERVQFERWKQIDDWIRSKRYGEGEEEIFLNHRNLRNLLMSKYDISWDTAERDIRNAKNIFKASQDDKEYSRSVYIEMLEEKAMSCSKPSDFAKLMELAAKLRGLFDEQVLDVPYEKLEAFQLNIEYNPEAIGLKRIEDPDAVLERWTKKKNAAQRMADDAEDAEYV